ncbi:MAG: hypothetical protein GF332_01950 [Candidatus Moranbacteria bacterium]|nr:hypothetical protein [Candidatus Moranbacteria bacterium]
MKKKSKPTCLAKIAKSLLTLFGLILLFFASFLIYFTAADNIDFKKVKADLITKNQTGLQPTSTPTSNKDIKQDYKNPVEPADQNQAQAKKDPLALEPREVDTGDWQTYRNNWYGFAVDYPSDYQKPKALKPQNKTDNYEKVYQFRKTIPKKQAAIGNQNQPTPDQDSETNRPDSEFLGFDVYVYNRSNVDYVEESDQVTKKQNPKQINCGNFPAFEEFPEHGVKTVLIPRDNYCYQQNYFYTANRSNYLYNVVAIKANPQEKEQAFQVDYALIVKEFPEFFQVGSGFQLIKINRPKPKPKAPIPYGAKKVNGKYVCGKKNDKPSVSKKNPEGHMDMQCCLDPDEVPNPWCTY